MPDSGFYRERFVDLLRRTLAERGEIEDVLAALAEDDRCAFEPPAGIPDVSPWGLPTEIEAFFTWCGGATLFDGSIRFSSPEDFQPVDRLMWDGEPPESLADGWFVLGSDGGGTTLAIDLRLERQGRCYAIPFESFGVAGEVPVVARSLTEFLCHALVADEGEPFWYREGFTPYGDAYEGLGESS